MAFLNFFLELLQTPAIILAIVALIGLIAQRKKFSDVLSGTVKTALGYLVLSAGSSLLVTEISPFVGLVQHPVGPVHPPQVHLPHRPHDVDQLRCGGLLPV